MTENKANILFYRGIPSVMCKKIKQKILANQQTSTAAPPIANVWGYLQDQFDENNLENDDDNVELSLDSKDDLDVSDTDDDEDYTPRTPKKLKKKVKFDVKEVPGAAPVPPPVLTPMDALTRQMEEMRLAQATFQATMLCELSVVKAMNGNGGGVYQSNLAPMGDHRCFICDHSNMHRLGIHNCPKVPHLIDEGLAMYAPSGRFIRPDGSELPCAPYGGGGVAKALRDE